MNEKLTIIVDGASWDQIHESHFFCDVMLSRLGRPVEFKLIEPGVAWELSDNVLILNYDNCLDDVVRIYLDQGHKNIGMIPWCHTARLSRKYEDGVDYILRPFYAAVGEPVGVRCQDDAWFPIGYKSGIGPRRPELLNKCSDRQHEFFFAGTVGDCAERQKMVDVLKKAGLPGKLILTERFNGAGGGIGANLYRSHMENAKAESKSEASIN